MDTKEAEKNKNPWIKITKRGWLQAGKNEKDWEALMREAEGALSPAFCAVAAMSPFTKQSIGAVDTIAAMAALTEQIEEIKKGDMGGAEAMLFAQAAALQSLWVTLMIRANRNSDYIESFESLMSLALKAQSQCRTSLLALNEIKFPKSATFVKQANIANQQQVNNGTPACAKKTTETSNKLLKEPNHATLDLGGTETASVANPKLEALDEIDGTKDRKGKAAKREKCP